MALDPVTGTTTHPRSSRYEEPPTRQTLAMLRVVVGLVVVCWLAAHALFNYHPFEVQAPQKQPLNVLAGSPKHAAFEFAQRLLVGEFGLAKELAEGDAEAVVEQAQRECDRAPAECQVLRARKEELLLVAELVSSSGTEAVARIIHHGEPGRASEVRVSLRRVGPIWKAYRYEPV